MLSKLSNALTKRMIAMYRCKCVCLFSPWFVFGNASRTPGYSTLSKAFTSVWLLHIFVNVFVCFLHDLLLVLLLEFQGILHCQMLLRSVWFPCIVVNVFVCFLHDLLLVMLLELQGILHCQMLNAVYDSHV